MMTFESWVLSYLANSLWQVPLLFAAGWVAARLSRRLGPAAEHRVWVSVVLLQALVPAMSLLPWQRLPGLLPWGRAHTHSGSVTIFMGPGTAVGGLRIPPILLHAAAFAGLAACTWFALRFLWRCWRLRVLREYVHPEPLPPAVISLWRQCCHRSGVGEVAIAASSRVFGPVTMGIRRSLMLLPVSMLADLPEPDLRTVMMHECAHIRRGDFLLNLLYEIAALPVSYHPLLWLARERLIETREMVCDAMAASAGGRRQYVQSLLRLASMLVAGAGVRVPQAIGIFDTKTFERRIMKLAEKQIPAGAARRAALTVACAVLGVAACGSAFALRVHVNTLNFVASADDEPTKPIHVSAGVMAKVRISGDNPVYPAEAKQAGIQGIVVLAVRVGTDGTVEAIHVVTDHSQLQSAVDDVEQWTGHRDAVTSNPALQRSAIDAVRTWVYKPFLLNGEPVEVDTTVNVIYTLPDNGN
jgi:hypothetical protein